MLIHGLKAVVFAKHLDIMKKISFLISAHNEEKIIGRTLENLINLPYENYEIILGLDGCTDNTEKIVKSFALKSKKIRYYKTNLRQGKPAVIDEIIKKAKGEIIIINDADWIFEAGNSEALQSLVSMFDKPKIGGVVPGTVLEEDPLKVKGANLGYKMVYYSSFFWLQFQKNYFTKREGNLRYIQDPRMFFTNIFLKRLYKQNTSLADDYERTIDILDAGYKLVLSEDINFPRMIAPYSPVPLKDLFFQKIRTSFAREQVNKKSSVQLTIANYYLPFILFALKKSWKTSIKTGFIISFWIMITALASIISKTRKMDTKSGWKLRIRR